MTMPTEEEVEMRSNHPLALAWHNFDEMRFDQWIVNFSNHYLRSSLELRQAAKLVGARPAEIQAALSLATLDEDSLKILASLKPAKTTWFLLSAAKADALVAAANVLTKMSATERSPSMAVYEAIREVEGPTLLERVSGLSSAVFKFAYEAATAYGALSEKSRKALKNFAAAKKSGKSLTMKQAAYAENLLRQLISNNVISESESGQFSQESKAIIEALGESL